MNSVKFRIIFIFFLAILILAVLMWGTTIKENGANTLDEFAKCLASKNITMYGTYNCLHCLNEKKAFGSSFQYVPYVECAQEPNKCVDAGIVEVPTWIFPEGKKLVGEQGLEKLSQESGCPLLLK